MPGIFSELHSFIMPSEELPFTFQKLLRYGLLSKDFPSSPASDSLCSFVLPRPLPRALSSTWCPLDPYMLIWSAFHTSKCAPQGHSPWFIISKPLAPGIGPRTAQMLHKSYWTELTLLRMVSLESKVQHCVGHSRGYKLLAPTMSYSLHEAHKKLTKISTISFWRGLVII